MTHRRRKLFTNPLTQFRLWLVLVFITFGTDKKIGLRRTCCYCHKGKAMSTLFFLLQAAACGFPEHFNLLSSWTRETWPCPLVTPPPQQIRGGKYQMGPLQESDTIKHPGLRGFFFFIFIFLSDEKTQRNTPKHKI